MPNKSSAILRTKLVLPIPKWYDGVDKQVFIRIPILTYGEKYREAGK